MIHSSLNTLFPRKRESIQPRAHVSTWIPAFAGMTVMFVLVFCLMLLPHAHASTTDSQAVNLVANYMDSTDGIHLMVFAIPAGTKTISYQRADNAVGPWAEVVSRSYYRPPHESEQSDSMYRQTEDATAKEGMTYYYRAAFLDENGRMLSETSIVKIIAQERQ